MENSINKRKVAVNPKKFLMTQQWWSQTCAFSFIYSYVVYLQAKENVKHEEYPSLYLASELVFGLRGRRTQPTFYSEELHPALFFNWTNKIQIWLKKNAY